VSKAWGDQLNLSALLAAWTPELLQTAAGALPVLAQMAANYISAAICASSPDAPASVCNSPGVKAATKALKLG